MFPLTHLIAGAIFSGLLYLLFGISFFETIIVFLSSVLIDIDHYMCYGFWKKDWSLKRAYNWLAEEAKRYDSLPKEKRKNYSLGIFPLHGLEILLVIFLLGYWHRIFFFVFIGFAFHIITDVIWEFFHAKRALYRFSLIYSLLYKWPKN